MLNNNQQRLLQLLFESNQPLTANQLSEKLGCSVRTAKTYVAQINRLAAEPLILSSRQGYVALKTEAKQLLISTNNASDIPQTFRDRAFYIIKQSMIHKAQLDVFDLEESLFVSYGTLKNDIQKINQMFSKSGVRVVIRDNKIQVTGNEKDKRRLISHFIMEEAPHHFVDRSLLTQNFNRTDVEQIEQIIKEELAPSTLKLNDYALINLMMHLLIMIQSLHHDDTLLSRDAYSSWLNTYDAAIVMKIIKRIENIFNLILNKHEREEIHMLFHANVDHLPLSDRDKLTTTVGDNIVRAMSSLFAEVQHIFGIDLDNDYFVFPFSLHLNKLFSRAMQGSSLNSPLTESLKQDFPVVFELAVFVSFRLSQLLHIPITEGERAYIALHIGAEVDRQKQHSEKIRTAIFSPNYMNLNTQLYQHVSKQFEHDLNVIALVNDPSELDRLDVSLLITTVPQASSMAYRVVTISPFMTSKEKSTIMATIEEHRRNIQRDFLRRYFDIYFGEQFFFTLQPIMQRDQVVTLMCDQLVHRHIVSPSFRQHVFEREEAAGTAFGTVALPHSVYMEARQTTFSVGIAKNSIRWGERRVNIVVLAAISQNDQQRFMRLYEALITMFSEPQVATALARVRNFEQFKNVVKTNM